MPDTVQRIKVFKSRRSTSSLKGKVIPLPDTLKELKSEICKLFNCSVTSITTEDFAEITDISLIRDNDIVLFEEGPNDDEFCNLYEWVTFNVGGQKFTTTKSTIVANEPYSMLAKMLNNDEGVAWSNSRDESGAYLIDRTPEYFSPILNFLRTGRLVVDNHINPAGVLDEARFYGIESIIKPLEEMTEREKVDGHSALTRREFAFMLMAQPLQSQLRCQGMNFTGIDLSKLDLRYINFKFATFTNADLSGANLSFANFEKAMLNNAKFNDAILTGVKMMHTNLEGASMVCCDFEDSHGAVANLEGANLRNADLSGSKMSSLNLVVACLKNATLSNCTLRNANMAGADLESCDLSCCDLHEANLRGANLKLAKLDSITSPLHMSQYVGMGSQRR